MRVIPIDLRRICAGVLFLFSILILSPLQAHACACCAESGAWFLETVDPDSEMMKMKTVWMNSLKTAALFTTAAGYDAIKGISPAPESDSYTVEKLLPRPPEAWLDFTDERGRRGRMIFKHSRTAKATHYGADVGYDRTVGAGGPLLYKELRFEGAFFGGGIFKGAATPDAKYRLVLRGRGNMCHNAEDYRDWILQVKGAKADFTFYGSLEDSAPAGYFSSPGEAVSVISDLLRDEDWVTLARYYDLTGTKWSQAELEESSFYLWEIKPDKPIFGGHWKYKEPIAPGFKFERTEDAPQLNVIRVFLAPEVGEEDPRRVLLLRRSEKGYRIVPPERNLPGPERTGGLTRLEAAEKAGVLLEAKQMHGFYCPSEQSWFFVRKDGSGAALRKKISAVAAGGSETGYKWESETFAAGKDACRR